MKIKSSRREKRRKVFNPDREVNTEKTELEEWEGEQFQDETLEWWKELRLDSTDQYERELGLD